MDINNIITIISTVGFPIASWVVLAWYIYKVQGEATKAINNNTIALLKLCDKLGISYDEINNEKKVPEDDLK